MNYFTGLDVSLRSCALCIVDGKGSVVFEHELPCNVDDIANYMERFTRPITRIGFEAGTMSQHLFYGLKDKGFDVVCMKAMTKRLKGKLFADKGYISKKLFAQLWSRGLHLITGIRKNMKNYLMPMIDTLMLRRRFIIETVFDALKSQFGLVHTRHRSPTNAMVHILSCIAAYQLSPNKPNMNTKP